MSQRHFGCMLSSGFDSSLLAALTVQEPHQQGINYPIETFPFRMKEKNLDLIATRKVARHIDSQHHEIRFTVEDAIKHLKNLIQTLECYDIGQIRASIGMYLVSKYI
ncbi:unnamed protein product [Rotaria sp. Silwood2]|nr:unnamed protein product [Rotaria sp. Silwood2]CAF3103149.1 unnamed protein product [Rotaria sp. Silwood2]CAF3306637.1 unnamed protein product [Rotaria sp. Silwood2]CAF3418139.1 unnamed protein product [Rotaria sp. Silwood2]CAF4030546.1 unnamed protein product [Rotaria sp. Silwood2]